MGSEGFWMEGRGGEAGRVVGSGMDGDQRESGDYQEVAHMARVGAKDCI